MAQSMDRRTALAAAASAALAPALVAAEDVRPATSKPTCREPARDVAVVESADVVVCGAGPAGVAAALAAARAGAKTRLIETHGCLGGIWTAGLLCWILDAHNKTGLMKEIIDRLLARDAGKQYPRATAYDPEQMKLLLEEMCLEAGVKVRLHTRIAAARCTQRRLTHVLSESKSGREAWAAKVFIDATGDGDVAAFAGCEFDYGRPGSGVAQPLSLLVLLTGIKFDEVAPFVNGVPQSGAWINSKLKLREAMEKGGLSPSYAAPSLFYLHDDLYCLMANHEYGVSALDAEAITAATLRARAEVHKLVAALRSLGAPWKNLQLVATAEQIGVREGRRIRGRYTVSTADLVAGARQPDSVAEVRFGVDVHSTDPKQTKGIAKEGVKARPYDIPFRALVPKDVEGLLLAGRCISGDFIAHSSYRVTGNSVPMGEAAGRAAAVAAAKNALPSQLDWAEIRPKG